MLESDVSVALCTYNGEKFLKKQLDSILTQTFSPFEVVIVDDNSTDGTKEILNSYQERYANIKVYFNEENLGYNQNFEKAISLSTGDYICISDQDDIWYPEKIKLLREHIGENWLIFSNSEMITENDRPTGEKLLRYFHFTDDYKSILFENFVTGHTCLICKDLKKYIFPIPRNGFYDWWIGFVALHHHKLTYLDEILTKHRLHDHSVIQKASLSNSNEVAKNNLSVQLGLFSGYKNVGIIEQNFITVLKDNLSIPKNPLLKPLYFLLLTNMDLFFPQKREKPIFSKLVFLYKYLKMHQQ